MALDDLDGCIDPLVSLLEIGWRVAGPYTLLVGLVVGGWAGVEALREDRWWIAVAMGALLGLLAGWIVDLLTRFVLLPLVRLAAPNARGKRAHLIVGAVPAIAACWLVIALG